MPTYKCNFFDNLGYINKKEQCPSYTDRILVKVNDRNNKIKYNQYSTKGEIFGSDHRPVFLDLTLKTMFDNLMDPVLFMNIEEPK